MSNPLDEIVITTAAAQRISELVHACDLTTSVEHLGRWKIRDVVAHLGGVHRWATRIVTARSMDGPSFTKSKLDGAELCDWFDAGVAELVTALQAVERDEPCPNFNPGSLNTMAFWLRRQMHETTVHRWDIEQALGCITPIDPSVAADGVDEFTHVFLRTRGKQTLNAPLMLSSSEPARSWMLSPAQKPGRIDIDAVEAAQARACFSGPPDELLLMLWGRLTPGQTNITTSGDVAVAESLRTNS